MLSRVSVRGGIITDMLRCTSPLYCSKNVKSTLTPYEEPFTEQDRRIEKHLPKEMEKWPEYWNGPERDHKNFPRLGLVEEGPAIRHKFIPEAWFKYLYPRLGVSGPYTLAAGLACVFAGKEIICGEEALHIIPFAAVLITYNNIYNKHVHPHLMAKHKALVDKWAAIQDKEINAFKDGIKTYEWNKWSVEGLLDRVTAKRENVAMQLEAAYRERLMTAYAEVKRKLDYHVARQEVERSYESKNLADYVVRSVRKSITPQLEKDTLQKCLADLNILAARV